MAALAQAAPAENLHITDLPYRLSSWALDCPANAALWEDDRGQLHAWAVMQTPFWTIDYALRPGAAPDLHRQVLAWVDARARSSLDTPHGHPAWFVAMFSDLAERIRDLEQAGYASQADAGEDSWSKVLLESAASAPPGEAHLPEGFTIRPLDGEREVEAYVEMHREVFETKNMTVEWRRRTLHHPAYTPDLDLVASAPDGRLAAFCVGWLGTDGRGLTGQIEPLGVRAEFRSAGLGRAILIEALRRLRLHGAERIVVETDRERNAALGLYQAAGFGIIRDVLMYRRDWEQSGP
jgi:mycothiol synthase